MPLTFHQVSGALTQAMRHYANQLETSREHRLRLSPQKQAIALDKHSFGYCGQGCCFVKSTNQVSDVIDGTLINDNVRSDFSISGRTGPLMIGVLRNYADTNGGGFK